MSAREIAANQKNQAEKNVSARDRCQSKKWGRKKCLREGSPPIKKIRQKKMSPRGIAANQKKRAEKNVTARDPHRRSTPNEYGWDYAMMNSEQSLHASNSKKNNHFDPFSQKKQKIYYPEKRMTSENTHKL